MDILRKGDRLLVEGSAGTGKTFLLKHLVRGLRDRLPGFRKIVCSAPTNKAVSVLQEKVGDEFDNVVFSTLHQSLKIRKVTDDRTGKSEFKPVYTEKNRPFIGVGAIIVDEASMVDFQRHLDLEYHADYMNVKVILVGDYKQLPPVGEDISTVFLGKPHATGEEDEEGRPVYRYEPYPTISLLEIVRQGEGNPIIELSRNLKDIWTYRDKLMGTERKGYIHSRDSEKVVMTLAQVNGTDELKYLGYTNRDVDRLNDKVRRTIYGNPRKVEPGESIIFNSPYLDMYYTNQELRIETVEVKEQHFSLPFKDTYDKVKLKVYVLNGHEIDGGFAGVYVIHEEDDKKLRTLAVQLKRYCAERRMLYSDRDMFLSQFADIKYNHALTVHKSQGSTFKQTIVNINGINVNRNESEREKMFYTAVTRASDLLILYTQ